MALPVLWFIRKEITKQVSYELLALRAIKIFSKDFNWSSVWDLKKIKTTIGELKNLHRGCGKVRLMFQDEAGFGRINHPKYCWCEKGIRPSVPCHHIREYRYAYGAVEPLTGESCFLVMPYCNTACMNLFLRELSKQFPQDTILMCCDGAAWHKSGTLEVPYCTFPYPSIHARDESDRADLEGDTKARLSKRGFCNLGESRWSSLRCHLLAYP